MLWPRVGGLGKGRMVRTQPPTQFQAGTQMSPKCISAQRLLYIAQWRYACTQMCRGACVHPPSRLYARSQALKSMQTKEACQPRTNRACAQVWAGQVGKCRACAHDGHVIKREGNVRFPTNLHGVRRSARPTSR